MRPTTAAVAVKKGGAARKREGAGDGKVAGDATGSNRNRKREADATGAADAEGAGDDLFADVQQGLTVWSQLLPASGVSMFPAGGVSMLEMPPSMRCIVHGQNVAEVILEVTLSYCFFIPGRGKDDARGHRPTRGTV